MKSPSSGLKKGSTMYLVDTNIFLEVLLLQDRKEECKNFLDLIRRDKITGVVTDFTIHSIIVIMYNLNKLKELKIFLSSLTAYKALHIYHTTITDEINAVETALLQKLDMDDAIQYSTALTMQAEAIVSFDKHFNSLKIPRIDPGQTK
jgi:predicted nucleic acid-binding protein